MSLDISLIKEIETCTCSNCGTKIVDTKVIWGKNISANLVPMAKAANLYNSLWGANGKTASDLITDLTNGLERLTLNRKHYATFNPTNGWGDLDYMIAYVDEFLLSCQNNPDAIVRLS